MANLKNSPNFAIDMTYNSFECIDKRDQLIINSTISLVFVLLTTFGFNLFWRKSFVASRDLHMVVLSEIIAVAIFQANETDLMARHKLILLAVVVLCIYQEITVTFSGKNMKRPRNGLDCQDLINFILTASTVSFLVKRSNQASSYITVDEKIRDLEILWASIPILSLFQIVR